MKTTIARRVGSCFLPNIAPDGPVDYVLIAMEPSFGGGSGEQPPGDEHSPKNFSGSLQDFILHFCIKEYLCARASDPTTSPTYPRGLCR